MLPALTGWYQSLSNVAPTWLPFAPYWFAYASTAASPPESASLPAPPWIAALPQPPKITSFANSRRGLAAEARAPPGSTVSWTRSAVYLVRCAAVGRRLRRPVVGAARRVVEQLHGARDDPRRRVVVVGER